MKFKEISVKLEITINPKPYTTLRAGAEYRVETEPRDNIDEIYLELKEALSEKIFQTLDQEEKKILNRQK